VTTIQDGALMQAATQPGQAEAALPELRVRRLGQVSYEPVWRAMQRFTDERTSGTGDELWLVQHPPVFTLGQAGRAEHVLAPGDIPVLKVDRGGQVTYHGPGQLVAYPLLDLKRLGLGVRALVTQIEAAVVAVLESYGVEGQSRPDAPGVYVGGAKVAALGLRVRKGCCFHGLAFNIDMDLEPFNRINPCGFQGLEVTQLSELAGPVSFAQVEERLVANLSRILGFAGEPLAAPGSLP
jgi:lipoyl(octanoyl) transferase